MSGPDAAAGVPGNIPDSLVIDAVQYAIGGQSHQVVMTCWWLRANWLQISERVRRIVQRDVEDMFRDDDRARDAGAQGALGTDTDRHEWGSVRALWCGERNKPKRLQALDPSGVEC